MPSVHQPRRTLQNRSNSNVGRRLPLSNIFSFLFGVALTYLIVVWSNFHKTLGEAQKLKKSNRKQQHPEDTNTEWITAPRTTTGKCDPPLTCAWSLDTRRTQAVSLALYHRAVVENNDKAIPTVQQSLTSISGIWSEEQYDIINRLYETSDANFLQRTGLVHLNLPKEVHVIPMGGEPYFRRSVRDADLILDGMVRNAAKLPQAGQAWLDFGGSHGRIAQIMKAAYPDTEWHVVDPIASTVEWAKTRLPQVHFEVMTDPKPPMTAYKANQFHGIYALSIWSHYSEEAALEWFGEMHRILVPGGRLWFSTHGHQALNFASLNAAVVHPFRDRMMASLYTNGHFYFPMFGDKGDWGVSDQHGGSWWGYGAFTAEWLAAKVLNAKVDGKPSSQGRWRMEYYGPGANEYHQDVYVLTKLG